MENNLERIKIINTGVKAFTRCENKVPLHFHHIPSEAVDSVLKICTGIHTALAEADQRIFFGGGGGHLGSVQAGLASSWARFGSGGGGIFCKS